MTFSEITYLLESSFSLKFSNRFGKVKFLVLPLFELSGLPNFIGKVIQHIIRTISCLRNPSILDLCICRSCNARYIFRQYLNYFIFELFSCLSYLASTLQFILSTFFILWVSLKISCITKFFNAIISTLKVVILYSSTL